MADDTDSFFSRWSRRKAASREPAPHEPVPQEHAEAAAGTRAGLAPRHADSGLAQAPVAPPPQPQPGLPDAAPRPPPPTLQEVAALDRDSDYARFVTPDVTPEVRNAAMKKLFTDPHFNVMDGLDTYIDDYGKPDPLPAGMLRQMVQSQLLGLFDEPPQQPAASPDAQAAAVQAESVEPAREALPLDAPEPSPATPDTPHADEDTALQLQPDDAPGCPGPGPRPESHPRGQL